MNGQTADELEARLDNWTGTIQDAPEIVARDAIQVLRAAEKRLAEAERDEWNHRTQCKRPTPTVGLTATQAALLRGHHASSIAGCLTALDAIASGQHKVVEAQAPEPPATAPNRKR